MEDAATDRASRAHRNREAKFSKQGHDPIVVLIRNKLSAGDPAIDDRVVFFQQSLELPKLLGGELHETVIGEAADQQIGLARAALPGASRDRPAWAELPYWVSRDLARHLIRDLSHDLTCSDQSRSAIIRLVLEIARAGLSPFGQVRVQFMMVWQR